MKDYKWVIIDTRTNMAIHGVKGRTMAFSSPDIAHEISMYLFEKRAHYMVVEIPDLQQPITPQDNQ